MGKRKNAIEFWRFIFAIAIVGMHFNETFQNKAYGEVRTGFFPGAGLGVDFFFILSGFLMFSSYQRNEANATIATPAKFIWKKICSLKNEYFIAFFLLFAYNFIYKANFSSIITALKTVGEQLFQYKWELLMLHMSEFGQKIYINYPTWYISVMLIGIYFSYAILFLNKRFFIHIFVPLVIFVCGGFLANTNGTSLLWYEYNGLFNTGWIRCMMDIAIGCLAWEGYTYLSQHMSRKKEIFLTVLELFCISRLIYVIYTHKNGRDDFWDTFMFAILIMISFLNVTFIDKVLDNRFSAFLGKLSLPVYLNQALIIGICVDYFDIHISFSRTLIITIGAVIIGALVIKVVSEYIISLIFCHVSKSH